MEKKLILSRKDLCDLLHNVPSSERHRVLEKHVLSKADVEVTDTSFLRSKLSCFLSRCAAKRKEATKNKQEFENSTWFQGSETFQFPKPAKDSDCSEGAAGARGRPRVSFDEGSDRTKRRRTREMVKSEPSEAIFAAAGSVMRKSGNSDAAYLLDLSLNTTPTRSTKIKQAWREREKTPVVKKYSLEQALGLIVDRRLTVEDYKVIRKGAKNQNADIYPRYEKVLKAKKKCYPRPESVTITESSAEVTLQGLLDVTSERLVESLLLDGAQAEEFQNKKLVLISKYGFDGSSGQAQYSQNFSNNETSDQYIFQSCLVPLQLQDNDKILFKNDRANSTRFCRPIRFQMKKETEKLVKEEDNYISEQIAHLMPSTFTVGDNIVEVKHELILSMIDGKVVSILSETPSTSRCPNCDAPPSEMNKLDLLASKKLKNSSLLLGLSPLHAHIRFLEYVLHIAFRMGLKVWAVTGEAKKKIFSAKKAEVQKALRDTLGIVVDAVKQGSGTTNDGNTARRFFANPSLTAEATAVDETIIRRLATILQVVSLSRQINSTNFRSYGLKTYELILEKYPWYYVPQAVHRILLHGADIIEASPLPIGMLSEEAQEARNKDYKYYREHHTMKSSRLTTMRDLFNMMMVSTDPLISQTYGEVPKTTKKVQPISDEARNLLLSDSEAESSSASSSDED